MKSRLIRLFLIVVIAGSFGQCHQDSESPASDYLSVEIEGVNGNKLAALELEDGTKISFWDLEDALAMFVEQQESATAISDDFLSGQMGYSEIYQKLARQVNGDQLRALRQVEKRIQTQSSVFGSSSYIDSYKKMDSNAKTAISYGCATGSAQTGAAHKYYYENMLDYDHSHCDVNTNEAYAFGTDLSYVLVGARTQDNATFRIERWNPTYKELVDKSIQKGYHYTVSISYSSNSVDYIGTIVFPDSGVDCPKGHVCLVGDY